jgi:hypothetical protein
MSEATTKRVAARSSRGPRSAPTSKDTKPRTVTLTRWNDPSAWRWVDGHWSSRVELTMRGPLLGDLGADLMPRFTIQSVDRWLVDADGVWVALAGPQGLPPAPMNIEVTFGRDSRPTLTLNGEDGRPTTLRAVAATRSSITFRGRPIAIDERGVSRGAPLEVTIQRVGATGLRVLGSVGDGPLHTRLFTYEARKGPRPVV